MSERAKVWFSPSNILAVILALIAAVSSWNVWANNSSERLARVEERIASIGGLVDNEEQRLTRIEGKIDRLIERTSTEGYRK